MTLNTAKNKARYCAALQYTEIKPFKHSSLKTMTGNFDIHSKITKSGSDACRFFAITDENPTERKLKAYAIKTMAEELIRVGFIL